MLVKLSEKFGLVVMGVSRSLLWQHQQIHRLLQSSGTLESVFSLLVAFFFCIICLRQKYTQAMQTKKGLNQQCAHNPLIDVQKEDLSDEPPKATSLQQCEHMLRYLKSFHSSVLAWLVSTIWMGFADIFFSATEATATLNLKGWYISSGIWLCEILLDMSFIARVWRYVYLRFKNCEKVEESISFCGISLVFDL